MASSGQRVLSAYGPASLDFINLPNPVEPHAAPHRHPLNNSTSRTERVLDQDILRIIHDPDAIIAEPPAKRRKSGTGNGLNLPRLPVRDEGRRLRIPPTLTGLHQPPKNAGILPSISVDKPDVRSNSPEKQPRPQKGTTKTSPSGEARDKPSDASADSTSDRRKRKKWSDEETSCLLKGVARFGIGNWTQILNCSSYHFENRTALDLKDRFRVCRPDDYKATQKQTNRQSNQSNDHETSAKRDHVSTTKLLSIGIEQPFARSSRRKRRDYSVEEDKAIKKGFERYQTSWTAILQDEEFKVLRNRQPRDLRDRFRTRFPEEYKNSQSAPKPSRTSAKDSSTATMLNDTPHYSSPEALAPSLTGEATIIQQKEGPNPIVTAAAARKPNLSSLLINADDVFWGAPLETEETGEDPITLDRDIMDWAFDETLRSSSHTNTQSATAFAGDQGDTNMMQGWSHYALPSVAAITAGTIDEFNEDEQLELPSLMNGLGQFEGDGRSGGQLGGFYDLLS